MADVVRHAARPPGGVHRPGTVPAELLEELTHVLHADPIGLLDRLIAFDTVSNRSNRALIDWVADYLNGHGVDAQVLPSLTGNKANLLATLGPQVEGGIVLSGHTDVVPVEGQSWSSDPFRLTERNGAYYGRGAADMKGFVALALAMVPELLARDLRVPVHLAFTHDEETGCLGVPALIAALETSVPRPDIVVVGEPTMLTPVNAHKGCYFYETTVTGREAHSSAPHLGVSAISALVEIASFLDAEALEAARHPVPASAGLGTFDPPWSTLNLGWIEGGSAANIVANHASLVWDFRPLPDQDPDAVVARLDRFIAEKVLPGLQARCPEAAVRTDRIAGVPAFKPDPDGPAELLARALTGANQGRTVAFASEAGLYQRAGISTVILGPGDIAVAHKPDEHITQAQLDEGLALLYRLADWATA
ncbi:MAG: acetylornithine deacetylase [Rhodospirillaceae bacterium]|nr:acetylornithine deacetylase [Rhodospirillaceae bacterium]